MITTVLLFLSFLNTNVKDIYFPKKTISRYRNVVFNENNSLIHSLEPPSGGELKLLTHMNAENWAYNWIMYISNENTETFDDHFYMDYFNMRGMSNVFTNSNYFYLGFFPDDINCNHGPKYIGLFELQHSKRIFNTKMIIENPVSICLKT